MKDNISVIGAGISGLASAALLAKQGFDVSVYEKNATIGGRARQFEHDGFTFDMGPSWYWMPEVFERYYQQFGHTTSDFYELTRLSPSYKVFFGDDDTLLIPSSYDELRNEFENIEQGSAAKLDKFLDDAKFKYDKSMESLIFKPGLSIFEYCNWTVMKSAFKIDLLKNFRSYVSKYFKSTKLRQLMEFPILFLGAHPNKIPALYSIMNYADIKLGTWYPQGGMFKIIEALEKINIEMGVKIKCNSPIDKFIVDDFEVKEVSSNGLSYSTSGVVASADYHHVEQEILDPKYRRYDEKYWDKRLMAPSCALFYLGIDEKIEGLEHHNLFFDEDFDAHAQEIYQNPTWPKSPLFYVCCPSKTDTSVAPEGKENLFVLIPIAPGISDSSQATNEQFEKVMLRLEKHTQQNIRDKIVYKKTYSISNFMQDYNAYKGNAYGLANTLNQTGFLKPSIQSKKVKNLFFTGQLTVPGPGVPPALISGEIVANKVSETLNQTINESTI